MSRQYINFLDFNVLIEKKKNVKNLYLRILGADEIKITAPKSLSVTKIRDFLYNNLDFIKKGVEEAKKREKDSKKYYISGELYSIFGKEYMLELKKSGQNKIYLDKDKIIMETSYYNDELRKEALLDSLYRKKLMERLDILVPYYASMMNLELREYRIKNMKTRWGTCNIREKRIWINLKLAKKPIACLEYIVVHELTHLLERNHTKRFYEIVEKYYPKWREVGI